MKIKKGDFIYCDVTGMKGIVKSEGIICRNIPVYKVKTENSVHLTWIFKRNAKLVEGNKAEHTIYAKEEKWKHILTS